MIGDVYRPEKLVIMRRLLWTTITEALIPGPDSSTRTLEKRLLGMLVEERAPHWESKFLEASAAGARSTAAAQFREDPNAPPLGPNPFPPDHAAYGVFETATWEAKREIADLQKAFLVSYQDSGEFLKGILRFRMGHFNVSAQKATRVIGNDETGFWYESWIDNQTKFYLEGTLNRIRLQPPGADPAAPPFFDPRDLENFENALTLEVTRIVGHYKGEAARLVLLAKKAKADKDSDEKALAKTPPPETGDPIPVPARYPRRAAWFEKELAHREWNVHDLQSQGGPDWKTSRKILDAQLVSRAVLEKVAAALSKKKKAVLYREIPQD